MEQMSDLSLRQMPHAFVRVRLYVYEVGGDAVLMVFAPQTGRVRTNAK
ncbi:hypothetical protein BH10CYA1_BH10CYA1_64220 [soil metagenome]